jgi:hypothetical protein
MGFQYTRLTTTCLTRALRTTTSRQSSRIRLRSTTSTARPGSRRVVPPHDRFVPDDPSSALDDLSSLPSPMDDVEPTEAPVSPRAAVTQMPPVVTRAEAARRSRVPSTHDDHSSLPSPMDDVEPTEAPLPPRVAATVDPMVTRAEAARRLQAPTTGGGRNDPDRDHGRNDLNRDRDHDTLIADLQRQLADARGANRPAHDLPRPAEQVTLPARHPSTQSTSTRCSSLHAPCVDLTVSPGRQAPGLSTSATSARARSRPPSCGTASNTLRHKTRTLPGRPTAQRQTMLCSHSSNPPKRKA